MPHLRLNVEAAQFPLMSHYFGPSVVIRTASDNDYIVTDAYTGAVIANSEIGLCQPIYMHNVMPTAQGYQSVGYRKEVVAGGKGQHNKIIMLRNRAEERHYMSSSAEGRNLLYDKTVGWIPGNAGTVLGNPSNAPVTTAYLNGQTFLHFQNEGTYTYNTETRTLQQVAFQGVSNNAIKGITSSANALVAWDEKAIYWSSFVDPLDFRPGLTTVASSAFPQSIRGAITCCLPIHNGFVIYTTHNAVVALWTGDSQYPWTFREIPGSAGVTDPEHVSHESNNEQHYAWTTSGMQIIEPRGAAPFAPELTDYIAKRYYEQWLWGGAKGHTVTSFSGKQQVIADTRCQWPCLYTEAGILTQFPFTEAPRVKVNYVGTRFLTVSIGTPATLRTIIVYDLALRRWGKLMIDHTDVFEFSDPGGAAPVPLRSFGILQEDGRIVTLDFDVLGRHIDSVFIFGRVTANRAYDTSINSMQLACGPYDDFRTVIYSGYRTRRINTGDEIHPTRYNAGDLTANYHPKQIIAHEHHLGLFGKFSLSGIEIDLTQHKTIR